MNAPTDATFTIEHFYLKLNNNNPNYTEKVAHTDFYWHIVNSKHHTPTVKKTVDIYLH